MCRRVCRRIPSAKNCSHLRSFPQSLCSALLFSSVSFNRCRPTRILHSLAMADVKFGYLLEALDMGGPPHGGIAYELDRLVILLAGANSIRDIIAFPKTTTAQCALTHSPSSVDPQQLKDLSIQTTVTSSAGCIS